METLTLKWGTIKGWNLKSEKSLRLIERYHKDGVSFGCATQEDTPAQKQIILDLIDAVDGEIHNDWTGKTMTKEEAKKYVNDYGKKK